MQLNNTKNLLLLLKDVYRTLFAPFSKYWKVNQKRLIKQNYEGKGKERGLFLTVLVYQPFKLTIPPTSPNFIQKKFFCENRFCMKISSMMYISRWSALHSPFSIEIFEDMVIQWLVFLFLPSKIKIFSNFLFTSKTQEYAFYRFTKPKIKLRSAFCVIKGSVYSLLSAG